MNAPQQLSHASQQRRAFWLRHLHQWHWISAAMCLVAMMLFAATGITLNHAAQIEAHPAISSKTGKLPSALLDQVIVARNDDAAVLPDTVRDWLIQELGIDTTKQAPEWSPEEAYLALPRPGGDAWLRIELDSGALEYELTDRGWIAYLNDLHKGRNTGSVWNWFIDAFAAGCLIFCVTGLLLLKMHAASRSATWPLVGYGVVLPVLLIVIFMH